MSEQPPIEAPQRAERRVASLVVVHTGDGKGKTTAAMGIAMRAVGHGRRVAVVQFMKSGRWRSGERIAGERLGMDWSVIGDGFTWDSDDLDRAADIARQAWAHAAATIAAGNHDLVVLDEVTYPITWGWIDVDDVVTTLAERPGRQHVIITGRRADPKIIEIADLVTEMTKINHPFDQGQKGQRGIEW